MIRINSKICEKLNGGQMSAFAHVILDASSARVFWVDVDEFWVLMYAKQKDAQPVLAFHVDGMNVEDGMEEIGQVHSIKVEVSHESQFKKFYVYTPNQFDIKKIRGAILNQIEKWREFSLEDGESGFHYTLTVDVLGKFLYRPADKLTMEIDSDNIGVPCLNVLIPIGPNFDVCTSLMRDEDAQWIEIRGGSRIVRFHCQTLAEMHKLVSILLKLKERKRVS
jgi:hypothetical protein